MVEDIIEIDKKVADIMKAARAGKSVRLCLDVSASVKELFMEIIGLPAETEVTSILYFDMAILTSIMDVIFSSIIDFTGLGIPVSTRIRGTLDDDWQVLSAPIITQEYLESRLGGLTFSSSSSTPTDAGSNQITFVDEG